MIRFKKARTFDQQVKGAQMFDDVIEKFNPYHDPKTGRFTSGKGGGGAGGAVYTIPKNTKALRQLVERERKRFGVDAGATKIDPADIAKGDHSISKHLGEDGRLTPERELLHEAAVYKFLDGVEKAQQGEQTFYLMGGGPAAGKSSVIKSGQVDVPGGKKAVQVDVDECKKLLPEYQQMVKSGDPKAAAFAHEESSALSKRVIDVACKNGYNVVLDGTGDGSTKGVIKKIDNAKASGMKVTGVYVTCDTETAVARSNARAAKTGREVPEFVVRNTHAAVSRILPEVADRFDNVQLFDTNGSGQAPKLIATGGSGKGLTVVKGCEAEFQSFIDKGK